MTSSNQPLLSHARREAVMMLGLWLLCLIYTTGYCYLRGYQSHEPDPATTGIDIAEILVVPPGFERDVSTLTLPLGLGIPDWVFYGIILPWLVCIGVTFIFAFCVFQEDDLGHQPGDEQEGGPV